MGGRSINDINSFSSLFDPSWEGHSFIASFLLIFPKI